MICTIPCINTKGCALEEIAGSRIEMSDFKRLAWRSNLFGFKSVATRAIGFTLHKSLAMNCSGQALYTLLHYYTYIYSCHALTRHSRHSYTFEGFKRSESSAVGQNRGRVVMQEEAERGTKVDKKQTPAEGGKVYRRTHAMPKRATRLAIEGARCEAAPSSLPAVFVAPEPESVSVCALEDESVVVVSLPLPPSDVAVDEAVVVESEVVLEESEVVVEGD